jgi:hypothetical protein
MHCSGPLASRQAGTRARPESRSSISPCLSVRSLSRRACSASISPIHAQACSSIRACSESGGTGSGVVLSVSERMADMIPCSAGTRSAASCPTATSRSTWGRAGLPTLGIAIGVAARRGERHEHHGHLLAPAMCAHLRALTRDEGRCPASRYPPASVGCRGDRRRVPVPGARGPRATATGLRRACPGPRWPGQACAG